jgi:hypothetical protein
MNDNKKLSRGQFLAAIGGMALTAGFAKFSGIKKALATTTNTPRVAYNAYGNSTYGGKAA